MFARSLAVTLAVLGCASAPKPASTSTPENSTSAPDEAPPEPAARAETPSASNEGSHPPLPAPPAPVEYETPLLDEHLLAEAARSACEASRQSGRPLLLEFSAPWCEDCVVLERMKAAAPLAGEIADWQLFAINIGGGFEHPALMRVYRVNAIAKLVSVRPKSCAEPLTAWQQGKARTLDGLRKGKGTGSEELARWLKTEREHLARSAGAP